MSCRFDDACKNCALMPHLEELPGFGTQIMTAGQLASLLVESQGYVEFDDHTLRRILWDSKPPIFTVWLEKNSERTARLKAHEKKRKQMQTAGEFE